MGFETGLKKVKEVVKPGGHVAVRDAAWLKPNPPPVVVQFRQEYPEIDTVAAKLEVIKRIGYEVVGYFIFPPASWTEQYYDPMEERIAEKAEDLTDIPDAEAVLREARNEISIFRQHFDSATPSS